MSTAGLSLLDWIQTGCWAMNRVLHLLQLTLRGWPQRRLGHRCRPPALPPFLPRPLPFGREAAAGAGSGGAGRDGALHALRCCQVAGADVRQLPLCRSIARHRRLDQHNHLLGRLVGAAALVQRARCVKCRRAALTLVLPRRGTRQGRPVGCCC